ncbi:peptidoglycan hydrolase-like protein with peptidoglycan-binding domain [Agromyces terreus]|uniref:Peptidoglycan hydrolase-like protein with peptidoglycan-binding domain n=1 Tax=Agromyces terreus TaxID=424795 RepID=A0A9X2KBG2_9MICO|nr:peptidoglycan-binding domain-containing protein [Agromyces terreus]MCP2370569.1 peptidoglycan hydrolase-like protein with peptidoglycan-binding domain [Agromyces terreus]
MKIRTRRHKLALAFAAFALAAAGTVGTVGGTTAAPAEAATKCVNYNYGYGGYATCVGTIQRLLNYHKISTKINTKYSPLAIDNSFGTKTRAGVIAFQARYGLVADGIVGPKTWSILCSPQKGPGPVPGYPYTQANAGGCNIPMR